HSAGAMVVLPCGIISMPLRRAQPITRASLRRILPVSTVISGVSTSASVSPCQAISESLSPRSAAGKPLEASVMTGSGIRMDAPISVFDDGERIDLDEHLLARQGDEDGRAGREHAGGAVLAHIGA